MDPMTAFMLAMQAAGMISDYFGSSHQADLMNMGMKLQQAGIDSNIEQIRLQSADESLNEMKNLRQTMGSQIVTLAARGSGGGSAFNVLNEDVGNFNDDERMRKLNLLGQENNLKAQGVMSRLQNSSDISKLWQGFASRTFNRFPTSFSGSSSSKASSGAVGRTGFQARSWVRGNGNFGMTQMAGT